MGWGFLAKIAERKARAVSAASRVRTWPRPRVAMARTSTSWRSRSASMASAASRSAVTWAWYCASSSGDGSRASAAARVRISSPAARAVARWSLSCSNRVTGATSSIPHLGNRQDENTTPSDVSRSGLARAAGVVRATRLDALAVLAQDLVPRRRDVRPLHAELGPVDGAELRPAVRHLDLDPDGEGVQVDPVVVVADHVELGDGPPLVAVESLGDRQGGPLV